MSNQILDPIAQALADLATNLDISPAVRGARWDPRELSKLPVAVVALPDIERTAPEEAESQISTDDWRLTFPVYLFFDLANGAVAQQLAADTVTMFIQAIDADRTLGIPTVEASATKAVPHPIQDQKRALLAYEVTVEVTALV